MLMRAVVGVARPLKPQVDEAILHAKKVLYTAGMLFAVAATIPSTWAAISYGESFATATVVFNVSVVVACFALIVALQFDTAVRIIEVGMTAVTFTYVFGWQVFNLVNHRIPETQTSGEDPIIVVGIMLLVFVVSRRRVMASVTCTYVAFVVLKWANLLTFEWSPMHTKILVSDLIVGVLACLSVLFATYSALMWQASSTSDTMRRLAHTDTLTGQPNRRALLNSLEEHSDAAVALIDLDDFRIVNETQGSARGDLILRDVADAISEVFDSPRMSGRWDGEEFLAICPHTSVVDMKHDLDLALRRISDLPYDPPVTASAGLTHTRPSESVRDVLVRCDALMYLAKRAGKGRIVSDAEVPAHRIDLDEQSPATRQRPF